jgi:hypothetical protein
MAISPCVDSGEDTRFGALVSLRSQEAMQYSDLQGKIHIPITTPRRRPTRGSF